MEAVNFNSDPLEISRLTKDALDSGFPSYFRRMLAGKPNLVFGHRYTRDEERRANLTFEGFWRYEFDQQACQIVGLTLRADRSWGVSGEAGALIPAISSVKLGYQVIEDILSDPGYLELWQMNGTGLILGLPKISPV